MLLARSRCCQGWGCCGIPLAHGFKDFAPLQFAIYSRRINPATGFRNRLHRIDARRRHRINVVPVTGGESTLKKSSRSRAVTRAQHPLPNLSMKPLAVLIAMYCSGAAADPTVATDATVAPTDSLAEVVVTGLRQSLVTNETIKRNTSGIVDAITAEDIGKFPDTNLAESIQRIPGVTIDRQNNEGSRVTVRGFGPEFNLVTLNGRSVPGNLAPGGATATRSFDFENLSADGISGITVYKTGRADVPSGGIGSRNNITTGQPLAFPRG